MSEFVFVYGSLKRGFGNNEVIPTGSSFLGESRTLKSEFTMYSFTGYPAVKQDGEWKIAGEIYEVPNLYALDRLEGNGMFYQRERVEVEDFDERVWMYLLLGRPPKSFNRVEIDHENVARWTLGDYGY